jgi:SAM-dependent methyltransferase
MTTAPQLFDRPALTARRARATPDALFLHHAALDEAQDRIAMVNRTFTSVAVITPFPDIWSDAFPDATVVADLDTLPLAANSYDLVIHAMCLHWANDPVGQLIQCRRALREDGLFLGVMLGGQTLHELRATLSEAESQVSGGLSPRVAPMGDIRDLGGLIQRAGLALPVADGNILTVEYRDLSHLMHDLRSMGETNVLSARLRHPTKRSVFDAASQIYRTHYSNHADRIAATFDIITLTGWAPSESQPKPLRPGSAQARLADALGTPETRLPD